MSNFYNPNQQYNPDPNQFPPLTAQQATAPNSQQQTSQGDFTQQPIAPPFELAAGMKTNVASFVPDFVVGGYSDGPAVGEAFGQQSKKKKGPTKEEIEA